MFNIHGNSVIPNAHVPRYLPRIAIFFLVCFALLSSCHLYAGSNIRQCEQLIIDEVAAEGSEAVRAEWAATSCARRKGDKVKRWPNLARTRAKWEQTDLEINSLVCTDGKSFYVRT